MPMSGACARSASAYSASVVELGPANREVDLAVAAADVEGLQVAHADAQVR